MSGSRRTTLTRETSANTIATMNNTSAAFDSRMSVESKLVSRRFIYPSVAVANVDLFACVIEGIVRRLMLPLLCSREYV